MTIRAKLTISMLIQIVLVVLAGIVLASTLHAISRANDKNTRTVKLNESITEMRSITFEHLLNHDDRSLEQWNSKYRTLAGQLTPKAGDSPAERQILADMTAQHQAVKSLFDRLSASYREPVSGQDASTVSIFQERLAGQLLVKQQAQIAESITLASLSQNDITAQHIESFWLLIGVIIVMLLVTVMNAWTIQSTITASLATLQQGATAVAAGNLGYRIARQRNDEFGRLAAAFNIMATSLQQMDQTKSEFILMASHQLRTPATAVKGFLALLQDGYAGRLTANQLDTVQSANSENNRQLELIDEMLVVAQAETGEMMLSKSPTNLIQLITDIIATQSVMLKLRSQTITAVLPKTFLQLSVDAGRLRLVIENLVANACKYSPDRTNIEITLRQSKNKVIIEVKDNGFGISKTDQSKLFKKFSRLSNTGNIRVEGSGLGLYLSKKIIDLHHGKITVTSQEGRGSVFTIHLPITPVEL